MKWTLMLLLCCAVTLAVATALEITNRMPRVLVQQPTPLVHHLDGISGRGEEVNEVHEIFEKSFDHTEGSTLEPVSAEHYDDNVDKDERPTKESVEDYSKTKLLRMAAEKSLDYSTKKCTLEMGCAENKDIPKNRAVENADDQIVTTTSGPVRGVKGILGNTINYFDIPYGRFSNKFEAPTAPVPWTNILENTKHTVQCPQLDGDTYKGDINCLSLSVFTRANIINASVLFYIHESAFSTGSGDPAIYNPEGLVNRNIILVLPNYRLGPLGFLCLQNSTAPGNAALKDLTLALEWTRYNIQGFGGDQFNIAVSGDGASAALAGYLALSPKSRKYISKVITDSGTALSHWAIDRNPIDSAGKLAELIRSDMEENTLDADLFREVDEEKLVKLANSTKLRPCIEQPEERSFITATPWKILSTQTIEISFIIGTANHAGLLEALKHDEDSITELNERFTNYLPNDLSFQTSSEMHTVGVTLRDQYFGKGNITLERSKELSLYHTDASYLGPSLRVARALVKAGARVFLYEFSFVGALNKNLVSLENPPEYGAVRGDIVGYLFPTNLALMQRGEVTDENEEAEKRIVEMMTDLWVSFLETGEPTADGIEWRPLNLTTDVMEDYLCIGNETSPANGVHPDRLRLWTDIYRQHFVDKNDGVGMASGNYVVAIAFIFISMSKMFVG